jgi:copper chaperone
MSCNHCKINIEKSLKGIGVRGDVNLESKSVNVEYDETKIKIQQIINEIEEQGYVVKRT